MKKPAAYAKIVVTIGPASRDYAAVSRMVQAGTRVFRLNFSHGTHEDHLQSTLIIRNVSQDTGIPLAIFQDLQGPKIRIGMLEHPDIAVHPGDRLIVSEKPVMGNREMISIDYPYLHEEVSPGTKILIDDGLVSLEVAGVAGDQIETIVIDGGAIRPRKGVNLPNTPLSRLSSYTKKDEEDLAFAFENDLDYVALSFVRSSIDVTALKEYMNRTYGREIPVIAKIEKPEAVKDIDSIIAVSSAVMIARGDLGVETSPEEVPMIQKSIIRRCYLAGVPVITATQMLESMMHNPRPTRAEAADVANAVLDGTSAVMLSGETAAGKYPVESVEIMKRIITHTEASIEYQRLVLDQRLNREDMEINRRRSMTEAVGLATRELALAIKASYIASFTHSGGSARLVSKFRPGIPIIGFSPVEATVRRLALSWGVTPVFIPDQASVDDLLMYAPEYLKALGLVSPGDTIVITAGVPVGSPGKTNMIKATEIT